MWRPGRVIELTAGRAIGAFSGFVDFWNWMANFLFHIKGDGAVEIDETSPGRPVLKLSGFASASTGSIPTKSGNSLSWTDAGQDDIDVITDISFVNVSGSLKCNVTKRTLKKISLGGTSSESEPVSSVSRTDIITNVSYNEDGDYALKISRGSAYVLSASPSYTETVFTTTEHS